MPAQSSPPWTRASSLRRRIGYAHPDLRVSDAERAEVADRLGKHYGDGRLDQAEFNERVDQAMRAKTQSDLAGLFDDLPGTEPAPEPLGRQPRGHANHRLLFIALVIALAATVGHPLTWPYFPPWLLIGLLVAIVLYARRPRDDHHDRRDHRSGPPARP